MEGSGEDPYMPLTTVASTYFQAIPNQDDLVVIRAADLLLPPHLRLPMPCLMPDVDTNRHPEPLNVQRGRVFCQMGDCMVLAVSHKYEDICVTSILYLPKCRATRPALPAPMGGAGALGGMSALGLESGDDVHLLTPDVPVQHLTSVAIPETQQQRLGGKEVVVYTVEAHLSEGGSAAAPAPLRTHRRYRHFQLLDDLLRKEYGDVLPRLPPKALDNLQASFVEERRRLLEEYLRWCLAQPAIAHSTIFCNFLGHFDQHSTIQQSSSGGGLGLWLNLTMRTVCCCQC